MGLDPGGIAAVFVSHLHGDHFGGLPFLILDAQFAGRTAPLAVAGPPGTGPRLTEAMECLFPGSSRARRRFTVEVTELNPQDAVTMAGVRAQAFPAARPSGAPALILRLTLGGRITLGRGRITARRTVLDSHAADMRTPGGLPPDGARRAGPAGVTRPRSRRLGRQRARVQDRPVPRRQHGHGGPRGDHRHRAVGTSTGRCR